MKVAFYVPDLKKVSAITKIILALEKELTKLGFQIDFILQKELVEEKILGKIFFLRSKNDLDRAKEIKEISENYDLILGFMLPMTNVLAFSRLLGNKRPLIGSIHNNDHYLKYGKAIYLPSRLIQKFLFERLDKIVVVSEAVKQDLRKTYWISEEKMITIYNPIDVDEIREQAQEEVEEEYKKIFEKPVIVNVGRLHKQKGQWHLLRIFKMLIESGEDLNLLILGDGELRDYLVNLSKDLGIQNRVFFLGFQKNPYKFVKRSKVFVFTSLWEGFGNAIVEAMALGIPFVASDTQVGYKEVINGGGFFASLSNYEDFVEKIRKLLKDEELYKKLSEEAVRASERFRPSKIAVEYAKLFESVRHG